MTTILSDRPTVGSLTDNDISDAYNYLLGRLLVIRQEKLDFRDEGFKWNEIIYRKPGGVAWANPNLDVAYSEAWVGIDENTPAILEVPVVPKDRYYTWQMLNGWGETIVNINPRGYPDHPTGTFALVLKGSSPQIPDGAVKIELPGRKTRVLSRVELGADPAEAERLQHAFKLRSVGNPRMDPPVDIPLFKNDALPGVEAFDTATAVLASEPDINSGMEPLQQKVAETVKLAQSGPEGRARVQEAIEKVAHPAFAEKLKSPGTTKNNWSAPSTIGKYGDDYMARTLINLLGIWANDNSQAVYFKTDSDGRGTKVDGANVYKMTFPADQLPATLVDYFWSVIAVDSVKYQVIPNQFDRFLLNKESGVKPNADGSISLWFAPEKPADSPAENWLPTPRGQNYNLTFRFYGPKEALLKGGYFPPPLLRS